MPSEFKETAEDLNTATGVQGNVNGSTTDRLAEAEAIAAVPDEAADIASKLLDQVVTGHLDAAHEYVENDGGAVEDYSPHPASIESDACAIVAAVTPILLAQLQERLDTAEGLVADLVDSGKCGFDHNGHCQEHGWFETEPACPHGRAKALGLDGGGSDAE